MLSSRFFRTVVSFLLFLLLEIFNFSLDLSVMSLVDVRFSKIHSEDYSSKTLQPDSISNCCSFGFRLLQLSLYFLLRKEVIHPHVPVGIPCYDLTPVIGPAFDGSLLNRLCHRLRALPASMV